MIIGNSAIQHIVAKAVAHTHLDTTDKDAYTSAMAGATAPIAAIAGSTDGSTQSNASGKQGYDESFAKMMVNLKAGLANTTASVTDDDKAAAAAAFSSSTDKQVAASDSVAKTVNDQIASVDTGDASATATTSARDQFLAYMNQSDVEKARQQLTGVSKEEYDSMMPEQQAAVDRKVADLQRQNQAQQVAEQEVNTKIAMIKAQMA